MFNNGSMFDYGLATRQLRAFERRNGSDSVLINDVFYYANGAWREQAIWGSYSDPPEKMADRTHNIVKYHKECLRQATKKFVSLKDVLTYRAEGASKGQGVTPDREELAELKKLQAEVKQCHAALVKAEKAARPYLHASRQPPIIDPDAEDIWKAVNDIRI